MASSPRDWSALGVKVSASKDGSEVPANEASWDRQGGEQGVADPSTAPGMCCAVPSDGHEENTRL